MCDAFLNDTPVCSHIMQEHKTNLKAITKILRKVSCCAELAKSGFGDSRMEFSEPVAIVDCTNSYMGLKKAEVEKLIAVVTCKRQQYIGIVDYRQIFIEKNAH